MSEPDYRAMWEGLQRALRGEVSPGARGVVGDCAADFLLNFMAGMETAIYTPDPDHVPAVRRVVAYDGGFGLTSERLSAYRDAANRLLKRAWKRRWDAHRLGFFEWRHVHWPEDRIQRLADWLRHRDEEAGHR